MITPADEQRLAELLHRLRVLRGDVSGARPDLAGADDAIDDALALLDEAENCLNSARIAVLDALSERDAIEAGDLIDTPCGPIWALPERYP